jgi:hypothetical protein
VTGATRSCSAQAGDVVLAPSTRQIAGVQERMGRRRWERREHPATAQTPRHHPSWQCPEDTWPSGPYKVLKNTPNGERGSRAHQGAARQRAGRRVAALRGGVEAADGAAAAVHHAWANGREVLRCAEQEGSGGHVPNVTAPWSQRVLLLSGGRRGARLQLARSARAYWSVRHAPTLQPHPEQHPLNK